MALISNPKAIREHLEKTTLTLIASGISGALLSILATIWLSIHDPMKKLVLDHVPGTILLMLPILEMLLLLGALTWIYILTKRLRLRYGFGVCWDENETPHCPVCKTVLANYGSYLYQGTFDTSPGFQCFKCEQVIRLIDETDPKAGPIDLHTAKARLSR